MFAHAEALSMTVVAPTTSSVEAITCYDRGVSCPSDATGRIEAHMWFNLAAAAGDPRGAAARTEISDMMTGLEIAEAQRRAREYRSQIARAG